MVLKEETLEQIGQRQYEEPDGEFLELIESGNNTLTVLTRVDRDKVGGVEPSIDPAEYSVSDLEDELRGRDISDGERQALLDAEEDGKNRTTAVTAINDS
jgi:hypothetical protein